MIFWDDDLKQANPHKEIPRCDKHGCVISDVTHKTGETTILNKTRCYLVGHMQYADPGDWREVVKKELKESNIVFYDPLDKPFISNIDETSNTRGF